MQFSILFPRLILLALSLVSVTTWCAREAAWRTLAPGIEYSDLQHATHPEWAHIHAFRIDLSLRDMKLASADLLHQSYASALTFAQKFQAPLAINAGFFDHNFLPLGLRIQDHQITNPLKPVSWWGVFYIKKNTPFITSMHHYQHDASIALALQSGPRLLVDGKIPRLKSGLDERSVICITREKKIILFVTEHFPTTTTYLARLIKKEPFDCESALNLDGGSSTQIYAHFKNFNLNVPGLTPVHDALIITKKIHNLSTR